MTTTTVLVTGVGGGGFGEQILKALKLAERQYAIVGTDISVVSMGLAAVDYPCVVPPASASNYVDALLRACDELNVAAVFPGSEPELVVLSRARRQFSERGVLLMCNTPDVLDICLEKTKTAAFLHAHGFCVPRYVPISRITDMGKIDFSPVVLKPSQGGGGSADVFLAQDEQELKFFGKYLLARHSKFIAQEYVGRIDQEYTVGVLSDLEGNLINSIALRRNILTGLSNRMKAPNRTKEDRLGPVLALSNGISQGEIGHFPEVTSLCERIALALNSRGPLNIQCRLVGDALYVFEINPRFSGTTSLRAMVGYNEPDVLLRRHLFHEEFPFHFDYNKGCIARGLSEALINPEVTARVLNFT